MKTLHYSSFSFIALVLAILSIALFYRIWKRRKIDLRLITFQKLAALTGALVSTLMLAQDVGAEIATAFNFLVFSLTAWLCILWDCYHKGDWRHLSSSPAPSVNKAATAPSRNLYKINAFFAAGPLSGIAAALLSLAITHYTGLDDANQFVLSGFLFPVIWSGLAIWACADHLWWRPTLGSLSSMTLAYLVIQL